MRVLVTGASGLLGGGVARALRDRGDDVTVLQRRTAGIPGVREVRADLRDATAVRAALAGQEAVVHLAAKVDVTGRRRDFVEVNVDGTAAVLAGCTAAGVRRLVHVSSPSVAHAGRALVGVGAEPADPAAARGPYARSKAIAELLVLAADDPATGLAVVAVRPHLVWGPGDTQLVARIVARAQAGRLPVIGSGAALVDTTYVDNAVDALIAALDAADRAHGQALVVSNGEPRPIAELLAAIARAGGAPPPGAHVPRGPALLAGTAVQAAWTLAERLRPEGPSTPPLTRFLVEQLSTAHWFDQRHTRSLLDWAPEVSLEEGLHRLAAAA